MVRRIFELSNELLKFYIQKNLDFINLEFLPRPATYRIFLSIWTL